MGVSGGLTVPGGPQLPPGGVGGPEGDAPPPLHLGQHEELQLQSPSAGQQQRLWSLSATVRRELPAGNLRPHSRATRARTTVL